jgi:hypothetical protein
MGVLFLAFLGTLYADFYNGGSNLHSHIQCIRIPSSSPPTSFTAFAVCFINDSHSEWGERESQFSFDLHFPGG